MWVDYLWTTLRPSWAQAAEGLWESVQNRPSELIRLKRAGCCLWKGFPDLFRSSGRFGRRPGSGRDLLALAVGVLEHRDRPLELVLEHALKGVQVALHVDERRLELLHVDGARELQVQLVERCLLYTSPSPR